TGGQMPVDSSRRRALHAELREARSPVPAERHSPRTAPIEEPDRPESQPHGGGPERGGHPPGRVVDAQHMSHPNVPSAAPLVSRDLFFTSKVTGTADLLGIEVQVAADAQTAAEYLADAKFGCVFIDLADTGLDVAGFFARLPAADR